MKIFSFKKGQFLIELLVTIGVASVLLPTLFTSFMVSREGRAQQDQRIQATFLLKEAQEVVRIVRDKNWTDFAVNGTYYPAVSGSTWVLAPGSETINDFTRKIIISDTYRDSSGTIVSTGGVLDPSTKKVQVNVSWNMPLATTVSSVVYITRHKNITYTETTVDDFNAGVKDGVTVTDVWGGEVTLGAGGGGDWCNPNLSLAFLDLPKSGVANAISAIEGRVFAGTGENAAGVSFANVKITNTNPPTASILGTYDGYKTNGIFGENDYAYLATDNNSKEVEIINLTTQPYTEAGWFNTPLSQNDATSVYMVGNKGYVTAGFFLYVFDLSSKSGSRPLLGFPHLLLGTGTSVVVSGNYAFVSISGSPIEMQIIDISNPWSIFQAGYADVNGQDGKRVFVNSSATRAYLATNVSESKPEFFIIDVSGKTGNRPVIGSYDANGMNPKDLSVVPGNKAIIVGSGAEEYQVLDIADESHPARCGGLNLQTDVNGIASVLEQDGDSFSYIITSDASSELKIIAGGPGGKSSSSGIFESQIFDATSEATFNNFSVNVIKPSETDIGYQVAVADAVSGNCSNATFDFVGPDGTSGTFFATSSAIPVAQNGGGFKNPSRCMKYKAYLSTSDPLQTPIFKDITFNYSP